MNVLLASCSRLLGLVSLGIAALGAPGLAQADPIPVGVGIDPAFVPFFVAKQEKLFEKHGVDVRLVSFAQGGEALDALVAGQVVFTASAEPTVIIRMGRADVRAFGIIEQSGDYLKLALRAGIDSPAQIKTIGAVPGGALEYLAGISLKHYGLDPAAVKVVKAGPPEMPALLARGDIDAFWLFEPFPTIAVRNGGKMAARSKDVGYTYTFWLASLGPWIREHKAEQQKIMAALAEGCEITVADPQKAAEAVQAQVKIPAAQTLGFLKEVTCKMRDYTADDYKSFDAIADFLAAAKITPTRVDYRSHIDAGTWK